MNDRQHVTPMFASRQLAGVLSRFGTVVLLALVIGLPTLAQPATRWIRTLDTPPQSTFNSGPSLAHRTLASGTTMVVGRTGSISFSSVVDSAGVQVGGSRFPLAADAAAVGPFGEVFLVMGSGGMSVGKYDGFAGRPMWNALAFPVTSSYVTIVEVALDRRGNVIVLGKQNDDFVVVKVDGVSGSVQWNWSPVTAEYDEPKDIAIDAYGDVVVLGNTGTEFTTTKLSGVTGLVMWSDRFDSGTPSNDSAVSVNLDSVGYILVARANGTGISAVKYSSAGGRIWARSHVNGAVLAGPYAATVDGSDDLIVAGANSTQWAVVKFHGASGGVLWESAVNVTGSRFPVAVRADGAGDVYVSGDDDSPYYTSTVGVVLKCLGATGDVAWLKEVTDLNIRQFSLDSAGRPIVTGGHMNYGYGVVTRALSPGAGTEEWSHTSSTWAVADHYMNASAVDGSGNVIVGTDQAEGWTVAKLDPAGNLLWTHVRPSSYPGATLVDLALDPAGNVLVAVSEYGFNDSISVHKLDAAAGTALWSNSWDRGIYNHDANPRGIAVDSLGNSYIAGYSDGDSGQDLVLLSYDPNGLLRWVAPFDTAVSDEATELTIDSAGGLYVIGRYNGDALVRKVSTLDGQASCGSCWSTTYRPDDPLATPTATLVTSFGASHLAVAGFTGNSADYIMTVRSSDGWIQWTAVDAAGISGWPRALIFDTAGNPIYNSQTFSISKTIKFDASNGEIRWTFEEPIAGENYDNSLLLTADGTGVLLAGHSRDTGDTPERKTHITRISAANGSLVWGPIQYELSVGNDYAAALQPLGADTYMIGGSGNTVFVTRLSDGLGIDVLSAPPPVGYCGSNYLHVLAGRNGSPPYSWSVISGALPPGLVLTSDGTIGGTPTLAGLYTFTVRLSDGISTDDKALSIDVVGGNPYELVGATPHPLCLGSSSTLSLSSGFASYLWAPGGETSSTLAVSPAHPTLYGVTVGSSYSCENRGAFEVSLIPPISGTHIRVEGSALVCPDGSTNALVAVNHGGGPASYVWGYRTTPGGATTPIDGATSARYVIDPADFPASGTYYLVYSTWPNCGSSFTSDETAITIVEFGAASSLAAEATSDSQITLTWVAAPGASVDHYNIYRAGGLCPGTGSVKVGETTGAATSWIDTAVSPGVTYSYRVRAASAGNVCESADTNCRSSVPYGTCSLAPTFAGATTVSSSACALRVSWNAASSQCPTARGVTYNVYRSTSSTFIPDSTNRIASCVTNLLYDDAAVTEGVTYYYVVRAEDSSTYGTGACNHGNEDGNLVRRSGLPMPIVTSDTTLLSDNFETGQRPANAATLWYEDVPSGSYQLSIVSCKSAGTGASSYKFGARSTCSGSAASTTENRLTFGGHPFLAGTGIVLPASTGLQLRFKHHVEMSSSSEGATLYYKTDLMSDFEIVGTASSLTVPYISKGAYNGMAYGRAAWNGYTIPSFSEVAVNLDALAGRTVWFRWRFTTGSWSSAGGYYLDDVVVETTVSTPCNSDPPPVTVLGAVARGEYTYLWWVNPQSTAYAETMIRSNTTYNNSGSFPASPTEGSLEVTKIGMAGEKDSTVDRRIIDTWVYRYAAFVYDGVSKYSPPRGVTVRPSLPFPVRWAYSTGASATTPPGILGGAGGTSFVVSNDRVFHGLSNGAVGGEWPAAWTPRVFDAPSQSRTLVLQLPIGGVIRKVTLLGAQNGYVHCVDAVTGAVIWTSSQLGDVVQGSPSAISTVYGAPFSLVFAGARTTGGVGRVYALDPDDGSVRWSFENTVGQGGDGAAIGAINDGIIFDYADAGGGKRRAWFGSRRNATGSPDTLWAIAFDANTATKLWSRDIGPVDGFPYPAGATLYVGTNESKVWAVDAISGVPVWMAPFNASDGPVKVTVWPDVANGRLYFSTTNHVWSIGTDGTARWQKQLNAPTTPNRSSATLLLGAGDGRLYQLGNLLVTDQAALTVKSVLLQSGTYVGSATVDKTNGLAYVGTSEGIVYAVTNPIP